MSAGAPKRDPSVDPRYDAAGWNLIASVYRYKRTLERRSPSLIDLGMGRGRDAIYFARRGFRVVGIESSRTGILRAERRAARYSIPLRTQRQDLRTARIRGMYDVVFSSTALNHLPRPIRAERFAHFQERTSPGGFHAVNVFVRPSRGISGPEPGTNGTWFSRGELASYYRRWELLERREFTFDCNSPGRSHRHTVNVVVARKPR
jgi:tellurite methyltransferase